MTYWPFVLRFFVIGGPIHHLSHTFVTNLACLPGWPYIHRCLHTDTWPFSSVDTDAVWPHGDTLPEVRFWSVKRSGVTVVLPHLRGSSKISSSAILEITHCNECERWTTHLHLLLLYKNKSQNDSDTDTAIMSCNVIWSRTHSDCGLDSWYQVRTQPATQLSCVWG